MSYDRSRSLAGAGLRPRLLQVVLSASPAVNMVDARASTRRATGPFPHPISVVTASRRSCVGWRLGAKSRDRGPHPVLVVAGVPEDFAPNEAGWAI